MLFWCLLLHGHAPAADTTVSQRTREFVSSHCMDCHADETAPSGVDLTAVIKEPIVAHAEVWERVIRKLKARQMPPPDEMQPDETEYQKALDELTGVLDQHAIEHPQPGRTETFRRLTRTEYQNAIRDLLAIKIDAKALLPADQSSGGFDNITVADLSPTLLNRYVNAAQKIARAAVGGSGRTPGGDTFRVKPDITQESHVPGLPIGTRGGTLITYHFPQDGEYEVSVRLTRDRNEHVEGLSRPHQIEFLLDRRLIKSFTINPPPKGSQDHSQLDAHLVEKFFVPAGQHDLGITFPAQSASLLEYARQPYQARFNMHRHPRTNPAVFQVTITGPIDPVGPGSSESRRRIFVKTPINQTAEDACARAIISTLARRAWRQPVSEDDIQTPMKFYRAGRQEGDFDAGIESAVTSILVNPKFLFRMETQPTDVKTGAAYHISDRELATRLSFFLWSSIPDDELLLLAEQEQLSHPDTLQQQIDRMLQDKRSRALVSNFASQWLYLRNLESVHPDMRLYPDFDDNLRQAMRLETELMFENIIREDRNVMDLIRSDYTYLNERLARHYGIPHIRGSRFRRVAVDEESKRGGLLRHGSILTVTSYATRTSPVIRGNWILKNILGTHVPPPPDDVPALEDNTIDASLSVRDRLEQHRADPNCSSCHNLMDPVGFALENYDAIGRWRTLDSGNAIDSTGSLPDGTQFSGIDGMEDGIMARPELFVTTMTEKLLTYATGRTIDHRDAPTVRKIVDCAAANDYRFSAIVKGIVTSTPFRMRTSE